MGKCWMTFAFVPHNTFWMGGGNGIPGKRQKTIPDDFFMGMHEVTQKEWRLVMQGTRIANHWLGGMGFSWEGSCEVISEHEAETLPAAVAPFGLHLVAAKVTDADLKKLAGLKSLQMLDPRFTSVTDTGLKQLRKAFPDSRSYPGEEDCHGGRLGRAALGFFSFQQSGARRP